MRQLSVVGRQSSGKSRFLALLGMTMLLSVVPVALHAQVKAVVLKGGKLLTVSHGVIDKGVLVMEGGKITAVGAEGAVKIPAGAQVIDLSGMTVYPGLIDSETNLGLTEISAEDMTNDLVETSDEIMPHMHVRSGALSFRAKRGTCFCLTTDGRRLIAASLSLPVIRHPIPGKRTVEINLPVDQNFLRHANTRQRIPIPIHQVRVLPNVN